ncbi:hypothetical protein RclHR1_06160002 [Rhizophagus clarus]|uniref:Uncharacterized protein n=1 Tax=Rhizophagus clarus TaxID=94130 RepID=A0A2Z6RSQ9_9GLOM|nr:hypothetical protein RclHR1_06160002 [Rhizophagus clarus]
MTKGFQPAVSLEKDDIFLDRDNAQAKASYYREKGTEKSTKNWIKKFEEFRDQANYLVPLNKLDVSQLQQQLVEYISTIKRNDGSEYKATSIRQAVDAINRYLLCHSPILQVNLHDKYMFPYSHNVLHGRCVICSSARTWLWCSVAINSWQIQQILYHPRI